MYVPKQKPLESSKEDVTTLDPELEEALSGVTDTELSDLAGEKRKETGTLIKKREKDTETHEERESDRWRWIAKDKYTERDRWRTRN